MPPTKRLGAEVAHNATMAKWSLAGRAEFAGATVADSRRDILGPITHSGHKELIATVALG